MSDNLLLFSTSSCILHRMDVNFVIKVADFGLSETIDISKDYFRQDMNSVRLPVKWLAPECLNDGMFSVKTDVVCLFLLSQDQDDHNVVLQWAFGVHLV